VSTRSVIARPTPEGGFGGTSCHNDGDPAHHGRILFEAVSGPFAGDPDAACTYLIDQHPAGWSVLGGDFTTPPGYRRSTDPDDRRNQCSCHGDRHDPPRPPLDDRSAHHAGVEYASVIAPTGCRSSPTLRVAGSRSPSRPGPTPRTGTPSTPTPSTCAASTDPATPPSTPSTPTSTASTLAGATSGRGMQGSDASAQILQPGRSLVAAALRSRCAKAVQSGYGGR
jgi:hypothetical protein